MKKILIFSFLITVHFVYSLDLKIAWWNLHNFFDTTDNPQKKDTVLTIDEYKLKLHKASRLIKSINADIFGVCEVENIDVLKDIAENTNYKYYYLEDGNDPRGINVAILSKYPLTYISNRDKIVPYDNNRNYKFSRDCAVAKLNIKNQEFLFILLHLKSKLVSKNSSIKENDLQREAEIFGVLDVVDELYSSYISNNKNIPYLLIMGDLNSNRYEKTLLNFEKSGFKILNYLKSKDRLYTYVYQNKREDIDYFLFNERAFNEIKIKKIDTIHSIEYENVSDHYPIYLKIKF